MGGAAAVENDPQQQVQYIEKAVQHGQQQQAHPRSSLEGAPIRGQVQRDLRVRGDDQADPDQQRQPGSGSCHQQQPGGQVGPEALSNKIRIHRARRQRRERAIFREAPESLHESSRVFGRDGESALCGQDHQQLGRAGGHEFQRAAIRQPAHAQQRPGPAQQQAGKAGFQLTGRPQPLDGGDRDIFAAHPPVQAHAVALQRVAGSLQRGGPVDQPRNEQHGNAARQQVK